MNAAFYRGFVAERVKKLGTRPDDLMHASIGIAGEAGELLDAIKKLWVYGKDLDIENVIEELGDIEFYMEALRQELKLERQDIINANIAKLTKRYPKTYTDAAAIARADKEGEKK